MKSIIEQPGNASIVYAYILYKNIRPEIKTRQQIEELEKDAFDEFYRNPEFHSMYKTLENLFFIKFTRNQQLNDFEKEWEKTFQQSDEIWQIPFVKHS